MNVNVNLMVKNVIQIKSRITINVGASPNSKKKKHRMYEKDYHIWSLATNFYLHFY